MAENKEYYPQEMENGSIQISEDVVASVTGMAVLEVEGVCGHRRIHFSRACWYWREWWRRQNPSDPVSTPWCAFR